MTSSPSIAEQAEGAIKAGISDWIKSGEVGSIPFIVARVVALLAETRGDEGFSSFGAKAPSSGTEQASEPAVTSICSAEQYDGTASASHTSHHSREPAGDMVARALCAERCAAYGEPPCYTLCGLDWDGGKCENLHDADCESLAKAIAALSPAVEGGE